MFYMKIYREYFCRYISFSTTGFVVSRYKINVTVQVQCDIVSYINNEEAGGFTTSEYA